MGAYHIVCQERRRGQSSALNSDISGAAKLAKIFNSLLTSSIYQLSKHYMDQPHQIFLCYCTVPRYVPASVNAFSISLMVIRDGS
jgi:hypothetical protein